MSSVCNALQKEVFKKLLYYIIIGVAKLGWSWEALDVRKWTDLSTMSRALVELGEQQGSRMEYVFVQEWVDFDIEVL